MNILHVVQLYHPVASGAGRYFSEIGERLVQEGHSVTVLATEAHDLEHFWAAGKRHIALQTELHNGVRIVRLAVRRAPGPPLVYPVVRRAMVELSRFPSTEPLLRRIAMFTPKLPALVPWLRGAGSFDIVHATNITLDFAILPVFDWARQHKIPFICTPFVHLGEPGDATILRYYTMRHQIALLRESERVLTMSGLEGDYLVRRGVPRAKLRRIGVGVNPDEVQGGDGARFRSEHNVAGPLVLYVGTLARDKGALDTVTAMQQLWAQGSDATLALIGAPLAHFSAFYDALPDDTKARIRLLPYAPDAVKRDAFAAAALLALPSRTDSFGIVYLEAWCYGLPVIGARAGGVPDVVNDGRDGLLVRFGAPDELAGAINRLLTNHAEAQRLGENGREKVQRELTWDRIYAKARAVYQEVGAQHATPGSTGMWC